MKVSSRLRRRFGLDPATFVALSGGEGHATFRSDELVVRFERAPVDELQWQYALVRFLSESVPEVIAPLAVEDGVSVWPFVAGRHARRRSREDALAAADVLRRLHHAGRRWHGGQRPRARTTAGEGERGPIHGDFYGRNILMRRRAVVGLFDWEDSCADLLEYELAARGGRRRTSSR